MIFGKRGGKRMHLEHHRLMSYPVQYVARCGVHLSIRAVGTPTIAYQDFQVTCPKCRALGPWHGRRSG